MFPASKLAVITFFKFNLTICFCHIPSKTSILWENFPCHVIDVNEVASPLVRSSQSGPLEVKEIGGGTKMNSLYQICSKIMHGTKVIIFVGSSPSQGDIFFLKSDTKWAFLYILIP